MIFFNVGVVLFWGFLPTFLDSWAIRPALGPLDSALVSPKRPQKLPGVPDLWPLRATH